MRRRGAGGVALANARAEADADALAAGRAEVDGLALLVAEAGDLGYRTRLIEAIGPTRDDAITYRRERTRPASGGGLGGGGVRLQPTDELIPDFTDLTVWAVMFGEIELAQLLWSRTAEPLRTAVLASRLCRSMLRNLVDPGIEEIARLEEHARTYERWACGILDILPLQSSATAMRMLTMVRHQLPVGDAAAKDGGSGRDADRLWTDSVMDMASRASAADACRRLVAHRHAQHTLYDYFAGDHAESLSRLVSRDTHGVASLWAEIAIRLLHVCSCGLLRPCLPLSRFVKVEIGPALVRQLTDGANGHAHPSMRAVAASAPVDLRMQAIREALAWHDEFFGVEGDELLRAGGLDDSGRRGGVSPVALLRLGARRRAAIEWTQSLAFFSIPHVKFYLHMAMDVVQLGLFVAVLGPLRRANAPPPSPPRAALQAPHPPQDES